VTAEKPETTATTCDLLVVGSGAAGLTAALTAAGAGLKVIIAERADFFGGTTALSEGMVWIPGSRQAREAGVTDSAESALAYMERAAGSAFSPVRARAFLEAGPKMLSFVESAGGPRFTLAAGSMDYHADWPGASCGARSLIPGLFDGRLLGADFNRLRRPLESTLVFGGMTIGSGELMTMRRAHRDPFAAWHAVRLIGRYAVDRAMGRPRGTRIANGNGLIAALAYACMRQGVQLWTSSSLTGLRTADQAGSLRVVGASIDRKGVEINLSTLRGVVLAGGGFSGNASMRKRFFPSGASGSEHVRIVPECVAGDTLKMAEAVGAQVIAFSNAASWAPASRVPASLAGCEEGFPHFMERQKPGFIAVNDKGRRFVNEATSYSLFVQAMLADANGSQPACWLICDRPALRRYGMGAAPPFPMSIGRHLRSGYLIEAHNLLELAARIGVDAETLNSTIQAFNTGARTGHDPEFNRGESAVDRAYGDPRHSPHPNLGALENPPYYAVRLHTGDIGSLAGLASDEGARVLDTTGRAIPGLCVAGNDAASLFGGTYPAGGITIGPAMTFGWIAARTLAGSPA
jgi:succinate dehydrogenase/fumarate reductase flavoprotein subunit